MYPNWTKDTHEQYNAIREKWADKELSFGCEVQRKFAGKRFVSYKISGSYTGAEGAGWRGENRAGSNCIILNEQIHKILGHPITLARVLWAVRKNNDAGFDISSIVGVEIDSDGAGPMTYICEPRWDLEQDDLRHQSPETVNFIHNLLI